MGELFPTPRVGGIRRKSEQVEACLQDYFLRVRNNDIVIAIRGESCVGAFKIVILDIQNYVLILRTKIKSCKIFMVVD